MLQGFHILGTSTRPKRDGQSKHQSGRFWYILKGFASWSSRNAVTNALQVKFDLLPRFRYILKGFASGSARSGTAWLNSYLQQNGKKQNGAANGCKQQTLRTKNHDKTDDGPEDRGPVKFLKQQGNPPPITPRTPTLNPKPRTPHRFRPWVQDFFARRLAAGTPKAALRSKARPHLGTSFRGPAFVDN